VFVKTSLHEAHRGGAKFVEVISSQNLAAGLRMASRAISRAFSKMFLVKPRNVIVAEQKHEILERTMSLTGTIQKSISPSELTLFYSLRSASYRYYSTRQSRFV
jgi:hypothetical protein